MKRFLALAAALVATAALGQQTPPFGEKVEVNVVQLDAIVTDSTGHQILGLGKDDFVVTENGAPQKIDSVDYFTNRRMVDQPESKATFKADRMRDERYFVLFFDKPSDNAMWSQLVRARSAAADFVNTQMKPADRVAVAAHDVRLKIFSDFTSDKKQLLRALDDATSFGLGITSKANAAGDASILKNVDMNRMINHTGTVLEALDTLADATRPIKARKDLVLFSAGILTPDQTIRDGVALNESRYYQAAREALNTADVAVYAVSMQEEPNLTPAVHQTLEEITADTNGTYFRFNTSFKPALKKIENETNGYYLISYYAPKRSGSGFQKVEVRTANPAFRIRAREGYSFGG